MAAKISYFIIFGIISIVNGKPAADEPEGEFKLQEILQLLANQGNYDVALSHQEDGPKNHHENSARIYSDGKHRDNYNKKEKQYATQYSDSVEDADYNRRPDNNLQVLNNILQSNDNKLQYKSNAKDVLDRLLLVSLDSDNFKVHKARENEKNNEDIVNFLNYLEKNIADDGSFVSKLRCAGDRCERDRNNQNDDYNDNDRDRDNLQILRQVDGINLDSKLLKKKIKVSDDLDAVVLGMSDVERLLSGSNSPNLQQPSNSKGPALLENVNLESLLNGQGNVKKSNVEALVFDLTRVDNGDALAAQIKNLISDNNKGQGDGLEDYVSGIENQVNNIGKKGEYKILAHDEDNNNVYLPKWMLYEITKPNLKESDIVELLKLYLPRSKQQKKRREERLAAEEAERNRHNIHYRRNFDQEVGVPFHLEVQGLGQVSPNAP